MSLNVRSVALAALLAVGASLLPAQEPRTGVLAGRVFARTDSASAPVSGVSVTVVGTTLGAATAGDGRFVIGNVPVGTHTLRVRKLGYRTLERPVVVVAGENARLELAIVAEAHVLAAIRTDARPTDEEMFLSRPNIATIVVPASAMAGVPRIGEPDVIRVVQLLPGVSARNDFNTGLNVRGGEADQNLILIDGYQIYNPFHLGGLFSTFMDATVGGIDLMTGAFPSRFGGRLSSVLDVQSAEETRPGLHASTNVSVLGATGAMSGMFGGGRGSWSVAGRRTYADAVVSLFSADVLPYHFRDLHGHASYTLPGDVRLSVTAYDGKDVLDANLAEFQPDSAPTRAGEGRWAFDWGNRVLGATLSKTLGSGARVPLLGWGLGDATVLEQRVSASSFSTLLDLGEGALMQRNAIRDIRLTGALITRGAAHDLSLGYEVVRHHVRYAAGATQTGVRGFDLEQKPNAFALYADDLWRLSPTWLVESGVRAEAVTGRGWAALSPRLSVKYFATPDVAITAAAGRFTQWLHSLAGDGPLRLFDVWVASDSVIPVAAAWHYVAGVERRFGGIKSVRVEGYVKRYERLLESNPSEDPSHRGDEFFPAHGVSYGVDLLARKQDVAGLGGWISYSYGVSSRRRGGVRYSPGHDRRHDLDLVATWRLSKYLFGARFGYATGTPYTHIEGEIARRVYDPSTDRWGTGGPALFVEALGGTRNGSRLPPAHRLDLNVSRDIAVRGATVTPYVSVVNAYNAKNVFVYLYEYSSENPTRRAISQFPVLPSVGVRVAF